MLEETRLHRICALLSTLNHVSTDMIIQHLCVSRETVRRDVLKLEAQGRLRRVHGGVISNDYEPEPPLIVRTSVKGKEKRAITSAAVKQLRSGQTVFIDAGSTTSLLTEPLMSMSGLTIITNSLEIAGKLSSNENNLPLQHDVILLGGHMGSVAQATAGEATISELSRYRADIALLSPVGISVRSGASSFSHQEAAIAAAMVSHAKSTFILADSSKLGVTSRIVYAEPTQITKLITDEEAKSHPEFLEIEKALGDIIIA
uniref:DeoR/GlpR transcriptional regulator n=1 Tax=Vibrio ziniensis TaxID=2711221 RepID=A0A6G7CHS2_9VIBR|nr:DeoR/GlpR transcriptional regulator [Vibrio ziniensis]